MRTLRTPHAALPSYTTTDALLLLRLDEAGGAVNFTDALGVRTMTQTGAPGAALSPFNDATQPAGRGCRTFDGATQYGGRAADGDQTLFQTLTWGVACWVNIAVLGNQDIAEYGEFSSPETQATNVQMGLQTRATGAIRMLWENGVGVNVVTDSPTVLTAGVHHIGVACEPDPNNHTKARLRFYLDGECIGITANLAAMDGGASSRWIIGAGRNAGSAVGTPGEFFNGSIDDFIVTKFSPTHEWFRETYANGVCAFYEKQISSPDNSGPGLSNFQEVHTRVLVEVAPDGSSWPSATTPLTLRNLTDLDLTNVGGKGIDLVRSAEYGDNIDDAGPSASLSLITRYGFWNLSPVSDLSLLATLFQQRRRIKIEQAFVPIGTTRDGADPYYRLMFDGWAWNPDFNPGEGSLTIVGPQGPLASAWVEPAAKLVTADQWAVGDRAYGSGGGTGLETCIQNIIDDHDPARFEIVGKTGAEGNPDGIDDTGGGGQIQIRVFGLADEHGKGRPHPVVNGDSLLVAGTTNFNGVKTANVSTTPTVIQVNETGAFAAEQAGTVSLLPKHSYKGGKPTLWCPTSPSWNLFTFYEPPTKSVMQAIQAWCDEIGWACRPRWDDTRKQWRLKLYDPRVAASISTITSDQTYMPDSVTLKHDFQRTAGTVEFPSAAGTDNRGERARYCVGFGELARDGDRYYFRVVNDAKSLITDSTAAQKELDTLKGDLGNAPYTNADVSVDIAADPRWDMGDGLDILAEYATKPYQMPALFGYETFPVINGYRTRAERGKNRTKLALGKFGGTTSGAAIGTVRQDKHHKDRLGPIGRQRGRGLGSPKAPAAPTVTNMAVINAVRYALVTWAFPVGDQNRAWDTMEIHYSTSTGFTPSSSTLKEVTRSTQTFIKGFVAGTTYYVKLVALDAMGNRSAPSAQTSFIS